MLFLEPPPHTTNLNNNDDDDDDERYKSPSEILHGFDIDCACMAFNGTNVLALPRAVRALRGGFNVLNPVHAWLFVCLFVC